MSRQMDRDETEVAEALLKHLAEGDDIAMEDGRSIRLAMSFPQRASVVQATIDGEKYEIEIKVRRIG